MRMRQGFVSNSSSTSYIIAYDIDTTCQCCGFGPDLLMQMFTDEDRGDRDSTHIEYTDDDLIMYYSQALREQERELSDLEKGIFPSWWASSKYTSQEQQCESHKEYLQREIANHKRILADIDDARMRHLIVKGIRISYHSRDVQLIFQTLRDKKMLEVINSTE